MTAFLFGWHENLWWLILGVMWVFVIVKTRGDRDMSDQEWDRAQSALRSAVTGACEAELDRDEIDNIVEEEWEAFHSNAPHVGGGPKRKPKVPIHEADRGG